MRRNTHQRQAIVRALRAAGKPLQPKDVLRRARRRSRGLGIATVYRALRAMLDEGEVVCVRIPGLAPRYELRDASHHHYFRCRSCRQVYNLQGCVDSFRPLLPEGFQLEDHDVVLYGRCRRCAPGGAG